MTQAQKLPDGWDDADIRGVIAHYDAQGEDEQAEEIETALAGDDVTLVAVPLEMADEVRAMIARRLSA
jgi:predicted dinucleotide-binding enzyme